MINSPKPRHRLEKTSSQRQSLPNIQRIAPPKRVLSASDVRKRIFSRESRCNSQNSSIGMFIFGEELKNQNLSPTKLTPRQAVTRDHDSKGSTTAARDGIPPLTPIAIKMSPSSSSSSPTSISSKSSVAAGGSPTILELNYNSSGFSSQEPLKLQYDPSQVKIVPNPWSPSGASKIKDFQMMAEACNRAGKQRMEALSHYKLGCMYEEMKQSTKAIKHYKRFLNISQVLGDDIGSSLALNCLGVIYQKMGPKYLRTALEYHMKHWEMADVQSKVVAHINMGLVFQQLGDVESAAENHRMAFQYALEIGDKQGESIALANLGMLGKDQGDLLTAQACMERHLLLSETMRNDKCTSEAYQQLGILASKKGELEMALDMLNKARNIATHNSDQIRANQLKCNIGIISGSLKAENFFKDLSKSLQSNSSPKNDGSSER